MLRAGGGTDPGSTLDCSVRFPDSGPCTFLDRRPIWAPIGYTPVEIALWSDWSSSGKFPPAWGRCGQHRPIWIRPGLGSFRRMLGQNRPRSVRLAFDQLGPKSASFDQGVLEPTKRGPQPTKAGPISAKYRPTATNFGSALTNLGQRLAAAAACQLHGSDSIHLSPDTTPEGSSPMTPKVSCGAWSSTERLEEAWPRRYRTSG